MTTTNNEPTATAARNDDARAILSAQHAELLQWCTRLLSTTEGAERFCAGLATHLAFENEVVSPAARRSMDGALLDDLEVEREIERELVRQLRAMDATGPMYAATLRVLARHVRARIAIEESALLPQLGTVSGCEWGERASAEGPAVSLPGNPPSARFIHPRIAQRLVAGKEGHPGTSRSDRRTHDEPASSRTFYDRSADLDRHWGRIADG
jgi:hypothetical protein